MGSLDQSITALPGVGPKKEAAFERLGIRTLRDMLSNFPRTYDDRKGCVFWMGLAKSAGIPYDRVK